MQTVKDMLETKGHGVWSIGASATVYEAIEKMAEKSVGALTVVDDDDGITGIISERDYARKIMLMNRSSRIARVADIMTSDVISVGASATIEECMSLMSEKKIRHLPVVDGGKPIGIMTVGDLLKCIIDEQSDTIEELESYILEERGGES